MAALSTPPPEAPRIIMPAMADRALLARFDPFFPEAAADSATLPVTALPFSLHGIRADAATGRGAAFIAAGEGEQQVFAVGESISEGVTLAAIAADHVVIDRSGTRETLWLDNGSSAPVQNFSSARSGHSSETSQRTGNDMPEPEPAEPVEPAEADLAQSGAAVMAAAPPRQN